MTAGPSVTVIQPAHDAARFVASAVGSVLAQTHAAFELIVVDEGSSDDTAARRDVLVEAGQASAAS